MKNIAIILFIILLVSVNSLNATGKKKDFFPASFKTEYSKSFKSKTGRLIKTKGNVEYQFPGQIWMDDSKANTVLVVNKEKFWFYRPSFAKDEKGELQIGSTSDLGLLKLLDALKMGVISNKFFKVQVKQTTKLLVFSKKFSEKYNLKNAKIVAKKGIKKIQTLTDVGSIELNYVNNKAMDKFSFDKIENKKFAKDHFTFKIPKNTNTTRH
jgi:outer membrane lipoprotein-sorting protein